MFYVAELVQDQFGRTFQIEKYFSNPISSVIRLSTFPSKTIQKI